MNKNSDGSTINNQTPMPEDDCQATDRGHEIELESGADDAIHSADATELLRMYVDIPGNTLSKRVRRKCVDFNVRTLLVSNTRLSTALKAWPIQLYFGVLGLVLVRYSSITL